MTKASQERPTILRRPEVERRTGLSRSTIYLHIQQNRFPKPIKLGARAVGWLQCEIDEWLTSRIENRDAGKEI